jgi:hypothetical protein
MIQTGIEVQHQLTNRINLVLSGIYQTSLKPVESRMFEYTYDQQNNILYEPIQQVSVISKAEAINLNIGLTYNFGKRNSTSE